MQEQYEMQVLEQQRQQEEQKKDTMKTVERRNTRSEEDAPGRITRGIAYATHNRHKYPGIQEALERTLRTYRKRKLPHQQ